MSAQHDGSSDRLTLLSAGILVVAVVANVALVMLVAGALLVRCFR